MKLSIHLKLVSLFLGIVILFFSNREIPYSLNSGASAMHADAGTTVEITARDYTFQLSTATIPSGWTTLRMTNRGTEHHLFVLIKLPEGFSYNDFVREFLNPVDSVLTLIRNGTIKEDESKQALDRAFPEWYPSEVTQMGGISMTAPGRVSQTTLKLEPGTYAMECYLKTPENRYHLLQGMSHPLTVSDSSSDAAPPQSDLALQVLEGKIEVPETVPAGTRTFAIQFRSDNGFGHDHVSLVRLKENQSLREVVEWIKLDPVMPSPAEFLGGSQEMPPGHTSYVTVTLEPGRYGWIHGVPPKGTAVSFTVE